MRKRDSENLARMLDVTDTLLVMVRELGTQIYQTVAAVPRPDDYTGQGSRERRAYRKGADDMRAAILHQVALDPARDVLRGVKPRG